MVRSNRVRTESLEEMSELATDYGPLLSETKPEVIHDERQNDTFVARLEELTSKQVVTPAEEKLIELLTVLIENFEAKHYPVQGSGPLDVIRHLMEENHLRQKDLVDVFGTESIVSDVLNGKRDLAKDHIRKLSERFGVSLALFF
jgi:HTH-type transcriptional regulator / antitoxin HigA